MHARIACASHPTAHTRADACASNHATVVAALLRAGADAAAATKAGIRPLHIAAFLGFDDCVEKLVRRRAHIRLENHTREQT